MELEVSKRLLKQEEKLDHLFSKYKKIINYISEFINEPDNVAEKITQDNEFELKDEFKNIKAGLLGEFTRSQTIDIGISKLTTVLANILEGIKLLIDELTPTSYIPSLKEEVRSYLDASLRNIDVDMLSRRKDRYLQNSLTIDFFKRRVDQVLTTKIGNYGVAKTTTDLLYTFREIVSMINLCETGKVGEVLKFVKVRKDYIKAMYKNIGTKEFKDTTMGLKGKLEDIRSNEIFQFYLEKINENDMNVSELEVINGFIDNLNRYITGFKDNLDKLSNTTFWSSEVDILSSSQEDNKFLEQVLIDITNNLVLPYVQNTITKEEFATKLNNSCLTITNLLTTDKELRIAVINLFIQFVNNIDVFNNIYQVMDEATFAGTLQDTVNKEPLVK